MPRAVRLHVGCVRAITTALTASNVFPRPPGVLSSLRSRNLDDNIVLDGVIPHAAIEFLKLLGVPGSQQNMHLKCCNSISRRTGTSELYI